MTVYILGAGPAGMAVVDGLLDSDLGPFVILERGSSLGGLAKTVHWEGKGDHDLGPHKLFSLDRELMRRVERLLPQEDWLTRDKVSSIFINGVFLDYPPAPFSLARVFGYRMFARMILGYGAARIRSLFAVNAPESFEDDLVARLGHPLYGVLFKPIAEKLWGSPRDLDVKLSRGRVQTPSLSEVLGRILGLKSKSDFEALTFRYPKGGLGRIWEAIEQKSKRHGDFLLGHSVTALETTGTRVSRICFQSSAGEGHFNVEPEDFVVSTLPLGLTAHLLAPALPDEVVKTVQRVVQLNDLILVFLHINVPSLQRESWVFVPDPKIVFHRLSEQESFDPGMTKQGSIVCCEIMSSANRPMMAESDDALSDAVLGGLTSMGYSDFEVRARKVVRLPRSYPVFKSGFENGLKNVMGYLDGFSNFRTIGRQGAFNYIGTLDAMDIGYGLASWLKAQGAIPWQAERERTNHYPVLD